LQTNLGLSDPYEISIWAGIIFAVNFVTSFLMQPFWGKMSDRYGRKPMLLRAGFGMAITMGLMGFVTAPWQLLLLRAVNGIISGFNPAAVALISSGTPKHRMGFAMGTYQSGSIAGTVLGPLIGGLLADAIGFRPIFYITGTLLFMASLIAWLFVKESFDRKQATAAPVVSVWQGLRELTHSRELPALLGVTLLLQLALMATLPLIPLFVQELHGSMNQLAFWAGLVASVSGLSTIIAAPLLGKLADRIGEGKVLLGSMAGSALLFLPQALVSSVWQLMVIRFALGIFIGGLVPSVNALLHKHAPIGKEGRVFSYNASMSALGSAGGPVLGGALSGLLGIRGLFLLTSGLLLANVVWVLRMLPRSHKRKSQ